MVKEKIAEKGSVDKTATSLAAPTAASAADVQASSLPSPPPSLPSLPPSPPGNGFVGAAPSDSNECSMQGAAFATRKVGQIHPSQPPHTNGESRSANARGSGRQRKQPRLRKQLQASSGSWSSCLPPRKLVCRVLKALRLTGCFFLLSILLGEVENHQQADCGFGWGWTCFTPYSCEIGKAGLWDTDASWVDRTSCWTWIDELYWATMTLVTIGYGDQTPISKGGRLLGALLVTMGVFCFTTLLAEIVEIRQAKRLGAEKSLRERLEELKEVIDQDDDGTVTPEEYIIFNLKKMGKVDDETLALLRDQFLALDADGSGELDADDIRMLTEACSI